MSILIEGIVIIILLILFFNISLLLLTNYNLYLLILILSRYLLKLSIVYFLNVFIFLYYKKLLKRLLNDNRDNS